MSDPAPADRRAVDDALWSLSLDYASAADSRDGQRFAALFGPDATLEVPKYPDDLRPVVTRAGPALATVPDGLRRFERTFHQVTNASFAVDGDGDGASGDVQCIAHHLSASEAPVDPGAPFVDVVWFIRYRDRYVRVGDGWRFARRVLHLQWVEEHPVERIGPPWPPPVEPD